MSQHVKLGNDVHYVSKTGDYECAAVVSGTRASLYRPNVEAGHLPDLSGEDHVHLTVFTPGRPGHVSEETLKSHPELADSGRPNVPAGSTYAEWDIPYMIAAGPNFSAGSWHWPQHCQAGL